MRIISGVTSFAADSRGITRHKGNAKYITKLQRSTKLEISFGSSGNYVASSSREVSDGGESFTIPRVRAYFVVSSGEKRARRNRADELFHEVIVS